MNRKQAVGRRGEQLACEYLEKQGYEVLAKNVRTPYGEIDLITSLSEDKQETSIIFIEVKTRTTQSFGNPEDAISLRKKGHILASIEYFLQEHPELDKDWRIDVISIYLNKISENIEIKHFINAISAETEGY
jgi:putative endonuclease